MSGFYVMHRGWQNNPILAEKTFSKRDAWIWLIENAAWKETQARIKGSTITIERGQLSFSQRFMAEKWGWTKSKVDRFLRLLEAESMIFLCSKIGPTADQRTGQGQSIITICNYCDYQDVQTGQRTSDKTQIGPTADQQRTKEEQRNKLTSNNIKEKNNKKEKSNLSKIVEKPNDVDSDVWNDFINHRKKKKSEITQTAMKGILREADKAGWLLNDVLIEIVARGWIGFNSDWVENGNTDRKINNTKAKNYDGLGEAFRAIARSGINQPAENDGQGERGAKIFMLADAKA